MSGETVAAVTVAYRSADELSRLLDSVAAQSRPIDLLVVIDNSCDVEISSENEKLVANFPLDSEKKRYVALERNVGSAGGFRIGMELALAMGASWAWLLDQDGTADEGCLSAMLASGLGGVLCPAARTPDDALIADFRCSFNIFGAIRPISRFDGERPTRIAVAATHGIMAGRDVIESIGGYDDERYFVGGEDLDFCERAGRAGFGVWLVPSATVRHPDLGAKAGMARRESSLRRLHHALAAIAPQFLGYAREDMPRRTVMIRFHRRRLGFFRCAAALIYSVPAVLVLKMIGVRMELGRTLKEYFCRV